jgi:hypothetical protein
MTMKHCTKFQVSLIGHLGNSGDVSTINFTPSTPLGTIVTQRKIIGSSCPDNMHIYNVTNDNKAYRLTDKDIKTMSLPGTEEKGINIGAFVHAYTIQN